MWVCLLWSKFIAETFENPWWRKDKQMQSLWFCILSGRRFEDTFEKAHRKQKGGQREQTMSTMSTQQSTCFCCWDDLSYGLNTLGPLCLWQCLQNSRSGISYFRIPVFLVIRIVFHFTPRIPTILLWPSASATCIYDIDYELQGIALNWHHQSYWVGIIISQSHISKVSQSLVCM